MKGPSPPSTVRRGDLRSGSATDHALRADQIGRTAGSVDAASHARCADTPAHPDHQRLAGRIWPSSGSWRRRATPGNELRALVTDEAGRNRAAWWPRSSGTRASYIPALASSSPTCRARPSGSSPLQQARDVRAMDQARQGSDQVDAAVMLLVRRQRCAPQAGQRPLHRAPWPLRHLPDSQCRRNCSTRSDAGAARGDQVFSFRRWPTISPTSCGP